MRTVTKLARERRRDRRVKTRPITLKIGAGSFTTHDWGLGGFCVDRYIGDRHGVLRAGDLVTVQITIHNGRETHEEVADARVTRVDDTIRTLAATFIELEDSTIDLLEAWLSGRMSRQAKRRTAG